MTDKTFVRVLGEHYASVGRPELEGQFVALLLLTETTVSLADAAQRLSVTRQALHRLALSMLECGDVKREEEISSKRHLYSLADHAYSRDLRTHIDASTAIAAACQTMLKALKPPKASERARRLRTHAKLNRRATRALSGLVSAEEATQAEDLKRHLERNWDAVPARVGPGRSIDAARATTERRRERARRSKV
jgi:predicted transcriptional regulator